MAICPVCGTEIEDWASYCPSCNTPLEWETVPTDQAWADEEEYYDNWNYPRGPRRSRSTWLVLGGLVAALFACVCMCCSGLFIVDAYLPEIESLAVAEATTTPAPTAPPYEQVRSQMQAMTEAQWKQYAEELKGAMAVNWTGWVEDVNQKTSGGYELWVDMDSPDELLSVQDVQFDILEDLALQLQKDQKVTFSGTIDSAMNILGSCSVTLKDVNVAPIPAESGAPGPVGTPAPQVADTPTPTSEPQHFSGSGKQISSKFMLNPGIAVLRMTHDGTGDFGVYLIDNEGNPVPNNDGFLFVVDEQGAFDGSKAMSIKQKGLYVLAITADGNWTVSVEQ